MCSKLAVVSLLMALIAAVSADGKASSYASVKLGSGGYEYGSHSDGGYNGGDGGYDGGDGGHHSYQKYAYKYGVSDHHTGDIKSASEHGDGGNVHGSYSLVQPDGKTRVVSYHADPHNGFNADVKFSGHAHHPQAHGY